MSDIPLDVLWEWWRELAKRELDLEHQYNPLVEEHGLVYSRRKALENLMTQMRPGEVSSIHQQITAEWESLRKGEQLPPSERKPSDVAFDVLSRLGNATHYRKILEEMNKEGTVIGGRDPGTTLIAYLGRDERFVKAPEVGRGYWKLKRWEEKAD